MSSRGEQKREPDPISSEGQVGESRRVIKGIKDPLNDIIGTAKQVIVTNSGTQIILSTPQDTDIDADVEFDSITLDDLTPLRMVSADASKKLVSIADLTNWIAGTSGEISVTDYGDGTVTIGIDGGSPSDQGRRAYFYGRNR